MVPVNLKSLVSKLNDTCRHSLEGAAGLCLSRTNYNIEIEHYLIKLLESAGGDFSAILRHFEVDTSRVQADLTKTLDRLKTGNARPGGLSPTLVDLLRDAWILASVEFGEGLVRSGHVVAALLSDESNQRAAVAACDEFEKINPKTLMLEFSGIVAETDEESETAVATASTSAAHGGKVTPGKPTKTPSLDQYTIDVTERARNGEIDPVLGRDDEIRQVIDILTRRRQNNPILTGEAGVGKTAAVEGFALRLASGDVPDVLKEVALHSLDLGLLQAGAGVKGEFENRLKGVIEEVKSSPKPIVLFIDEAHTMIGAGGQAGQGDAANLLKPALARGELRTIAATTWAEYKKYFERDAALARRFQVVKIEEPTVEVGIEMIRGLADKLEHHHGVRILDEAVTEAVRLSARYITGRQLPDKAVSLIDTACARVALGQSSTPPQVEHARRRIDMLATEIRILQRESLTAAGDPEKLASLQQEKTDTEAELESLEARWKEEGQLVSKIRDLRDQIEGTAASNGDATELRSELDALTKELLDLQGEDPLMDVCVDANAIAAVVSNWTGIPVGRMVADEIRTVLELKDRMEERVVGQSHGLDIIAQSIRTSRAKLKDPSTPIGVFMLAGPSGVGKTETAITLAELLYGGEQNMTTINMSEYKEEHKVSLLMGSPPGYVGYGEGGVLTEAVRRRPYSVVLLDELEKAHEGVQEIFYQVFDKGMLRDGEGRDIDFKNTVIICTSNAGTDLIVKLCEDPDTAPKPEALADALHEELLKTFKPAFLGRIKVIPYYPLSDDVLRKIVGLKLGKITRRVKENYGAELTYDDAVVEHIRSRCTEVESGARAVDHILTKTVLPQMSAEFLAKMAEGSSIANVKIHVADDGNFAYEIG